MNDTLLWLLLFFVGFASGVINVMAGGGSSLTLPVLIFMGMTGSVANGTNRIGILIQNVFAVNAFRRQQRSTLRESTLLSLWTLPGAIIGAIAAVQISSETFNLVLAIVMFGIMISMFVDPLSRTGSTVSRRWVLYPALFFIGIYGGFIQVGVGFLLMAALYHLLRIDLVSVNVHKVFIVLMYTLPAFFIFLWTNNVDWPSGIVLGFGSALGGWLGARHAVKGGEKVIRYFVAAAMVFMIIKLLGVW